MPDEDEIKKTSDLLDKLAKKVKKLTESTKKARVSMEDASHIVRFEIEESGATTYPPRTDEISDEKVQKYTEKALKKCKHGLYEMTCPECNKGELRFCPNCEDYTYKNDLFDNVCKECNIPYPDRVGWGYYPSWGSYFNDPTPSPSPSASISPSASWFPNDPVDNS